MRVYRAALELLRAVRAANITDRDMRDQALRAAKAVCRNVAEAAGRVSAADKARVWGIARGEAVEAIATTEIAIEAGDGVAEALPLVLDRGNAVYAMLSGLCRARLFAQRVAHLRHRFRKARHDQRGLESQHAMLGSSWKSTATTMRAAVPPTRDGTARLVALAALQTRSRACEPPTAPQRRPRNSGCRGVAVLRYG